MTSLVGCAGGGWTMVMKVDGRQVILCRFAEIFGGRKEGRGGAKTSQRPWGSPPCTQITGHREVV